MSLPVSKDFLTIDTIMPSTSNVNIIGHLITNGDLTITGTINIFDNIVYVKTKSNFPAPIGGVITLVAGVVYIIQGTINLGTDVIVCSSLNTIKGEVASNSILSTSNNANSLITTIFGVTLSHITLTNSTGSCINLSKVNGGLDTEITNIVIANSASIGTINLTKYMIVDGVFVDNTTQGLTLAGSFTFAQICNFFVNSTVTDPGFIAFYLDPTFEVDLNGSFTLNTCYIITLIGQTFLFDGGVNYDNIGQLILEKNSVTGNGIVSNVSLIRHQIVTRDNIGIQSSKTIGFMYFSGNTSFTTITTQNVYEKINIDGPGFVLDPGSELFDLSGIVPNQGLRFTGHEPFKGVIGCEMSFTGSSNNSGLGIRLFKNGVLINGGESESSVRNTSLLAPIFATTFAVLDPFDIITVEITNTTGTQSMLIKNCNLIIH